MSVCIRACVHMYLKEQRNRKQTIVFLGCYKVREATRKA